MLAAVPGVLIYKDFFRLIRVTLSKNILKNHSHKNKRAGIAAMLAVIEIIKTIALTDIVQLLRKN